MLQIHPYLCKCRCLLKKPPDLSGFFIEREKCGRFSTFLRICIFLFSYSDYFHPNNTILSYSCQEFRAICISLYLELAQKLSFSVQAFIFLVQMLRWSDCKKLADRHVYRAVGLLQKRPGATQQFDPHAYFSRLCL